MKNIIKTISILTLIFIISCATFKIYEVEDDFNQNLRRIRTSEVILQQHVILEQSTLYMHMEYFLEYSTGDIWYIIVFRYKSSFIARFHTLSVLSRPMYGNDSVTKYTTIIGYRIFFSQQFNEIIGFKVDSTFFKQVKTVGLMRIRLSGTNEQITLTLSEDIKQKLIEFYTKTQLITQ